MNPAPTRPSPDFRRFSPFLAIGALGIVFGDIGTSPLYALRECFSGRYAFPATPENVLGAVSLILWTLFIVVCVKYVFIVMRMDDHGEGGVLVLTTLISNVYRNTRRRGMIFIIMGALGSALLFADGVITPAVSVLSAMEGLNNRSEFFKPWVVPFSLVILMFLYFFQKKGTKKISLVFGPVMLLWFLSMGLLGLFAIRQAPFILKAVNPAWAFSFFINNGFHSAFILGSVFLAITGAEVLYADMGHFGKKPIQRAWYFVVFPSLVVNYMGQGASLMRFPESTQNLFFQICPSSLLLPLVALSTAATVIASQAVISGMFSLARQAMQLGYWSRMRVVHTSDSAIGQIYVPMVNAVLWLGTTLLVLIFRESHRLASAYGIAVSLTMLITSVFAFLHILNFWRKARPFMLALGVFLCLVNLVFFLSNALKIVSGGWIVVVIAAGIFIMMTTWYVGRSIMSRRSITQGMDLPLFVKDVKARTPLRVPGTAVFLTGNREGVPRSLLHNFKHNKIIHETVMVVNVHIREYPYVREEDRLRWEVLEAGFHSVRLNYGYFETPDIPSALERHHPPEIMFKKLQVTYFLGRQSLVLTSLPYLAYWRKTIFLFMTQNSHSASEFFCLPPNRVVEVGLQVEL